MGAPFSDITLYTPTPHQVGTPEYWEDTSLKNFVSDLYMQKIHGYKPPKTSRITVQPAYHEIWNRTWKNGSIVAIAPYYSHDEYAAQDKRGKYLYILDLIQRATIPLSEEYGWDKSVFENAYREVLESDFKFRIEYPDKQSRDKKKVGKLVIEKTETITSVLVNIEINRSIIVRKLFDKKNVWWYDSAYMLARFNKWFDTDRFGIGYRKGRIESWYSIERDEVALFENGQPVKDIEFKNHFLFGKHSSLVTVRYRVAFPAVISYLNSSIACFTLSLLRSNITHIAMLNHKNILQRIWNHLLAGCILHGCKGPSRNSYILCFTLQY